MEKYILFDSMTGKASCFYSEEFFGNIMHEDNRLPEGVVGVSNDDYYIFMNEIDNWKWDFENNIRIPIDVSIADLKEKLKQQVALKRYQVETGGIVIGGIFIKTDRESQSQANSAFNALNNQLVASIDWKGANGWISVNLDAFRDIAASIAQHVQECFTIEKTHCEAIDILTKKEDIESYNINEGWPEIEWSII